MNPEKIGRYEIKSELGRGGMATVYLAYDPRFEREVALKILPREFLHDPQFRIRFEREAKTIAALEHPAIVPVYDVGEEDGQPYFVMRYMNGGSLADRIKQGTIALSESAKIMERLCPALDEAHEKSIIHRDLKPGNILFDKSGQPYVSDFGIAKVTQNTSTVTGGAIIGTPAYMSPEQAQGDKIDGRSDIYALGVILFEMLTNRQPYEADTPMAVVVKHITDPIPHILDSNPQLPAQVEVIIERAMAKNRDDRFQTCGELADNLNALLHGGTLQFSKTESNATKIGSAPKTQSKGSMSATQMAGTKIALKAERDQFQPEAKSSSFPWTLIAIVGIVIFGLIAAGGLYLAGLGPFAPAPTNTATLQPPTATAEIIIPTNTVEVIAPTETATNTPEPTATFTPEPINIIIGGADTVAFIANNDVWIMNIDGSEIKQLTNDGAPKSDLQWMPDGKTLVFISSKNLNTVEADTGKFDTLTSFRNASFFEAFRISPDGKQVAISLNRELFIVPFDLNAIRAAGSKSDLLAMKGCLAHKGSTNAAVQVKDFRWYDDSTTIAWLFNGVLEDGRPGDIIRVHDISSCNPDTTYIDDEVPGTRFDMESYGSNPIIPDFDFDGSLLFLLQSAKRNEGWGYLYEYDAELHKAKRLEPFGAGACCFRDARWSPDKNFIFFAFQDINTNAAQFYYIRYSDIGTGATFTPIPMEGFTFTKPKEAPQPALHAAP
jgi:serine/threonine-protein kinase